jgi:hypothetical protein
MGTIYLIVNKINQKKYIGKTNFSLSRRWSEHCSQAKHSPKTYLHKAIKKYGKENFEIKSIFSTDSKTGLAKHEIQFIKMYKTKAPFGYNLTDGGEGVSGLSVETKEKIRLKKLGQRASAETRQRLSESHRGVVNFALIKYAKAVSVKTQEVIYFFSLKNAAVFCGSRTQLKRVLDSNKVYKDFLWTRCSAEEFYSNKHLAWKGIISLENERDI